MITETTHTFTVNTVNTVNTAIADTPNPPVSFLQTVSDSAITSLTRVEVGLNLVGTTAGSGFGSEMFRASPPSPPQAGDATAEILDCPQLDGGAHAANPFRNARPGHNPNPAVPRDDE